MCVCCEKVHPHPESSITHPNSSQSLTLPGSSRIFFHHPRHQRLFYTCSHTCGAALFEIQNTAAAAAAAVMRQICPWLDLPPASKPSQICFSLNIFPVDKDRLHSDTVPLASPAAAAATTTLQFPRHPGWVSARGRTVTGGWKQEQVLEKSRSIRTLRGRVGRWRE